MCNFLTPSNRIFMSRIFLGLISIFFLSPCYCEQVTIDGNPISYKAIADTIPLKDDAGTEKATLFYVAYFKEKPQATIKRPITFCFNGGPGAASVFLHMAALGPKKVDLSKTGAPPYSIIDNPYSILDLTDLVFIDPVSTGYSRAAAGQDPTQFFGGKGDIEAFTDFIDAFLTKYDLWMAPKFLAGESYGTLRATGLCANLQNSRHIYLNGIILISSLLNCQTINEGMPGNDLPYPLYLPSIAATAWYHKKVGSPFKEMPLKDFLSEVERFALTDYTLALAQGDKLNPQEQEKIVQKLSSYTSLSRELILEYHLRVPGEVFLENLLKKEGLSAERFDSRITNINYSPFGSDPNHDPLTPIVTAAFNHYVRNDLGYTSHLPYHILSEVIPWAMTDNSTFPWDLRPDNQYLNVSALLGQSLCCNTSLRVFIANGYYDMATPYFGTEYTINHIGLNPQLTSHITMGYYPAGHMMYTNQDSLIALKKDLSSFFRDSSYSS